MKRMAEQVRQKEVINYLNNELKRAKNKEEKHVLQQTIQYFKKKEERFKQEWSEFVAFAKTQANRFNEKIKGLGLRLAIEENEWVNEVLHLRIRAIDESIHYANGFCDITNFSNEKVLFDGRTVEKVTTNLSEAKESFILELEDKKLMELCKRIKEVVIDEKNEEE